MMQHTAPSPSHQPQALGARLSPLLALASLAIGCASKGVTEVVALGPGSYAIATTVFQADGRTSLVALHEDPTRPEVLDTGLALELGGSAALFGRDGRHVFALGTSDEPVLARYELGDDGVLLERARMSLQPLEVDSGFLRPDLVPFLSDTKAYWIDDVRLQVAIWDPERMEITGSFSLADAQPANGALLEFGEAVVRDGKVFVSASHRGSDELDQGLAVVLVIDTERDVLDAVLTDSRCGSTKEIAPGPDGTLYVASEALAASQYALDRPAGYPAPCVLRIRPGALELDADFYLPLPELVQGRAAGRLVTGLDGHAYVLALHEELLDAPLGANTDLYAPWDSTAWRWWRVELGQSSAGQLVANAPVAGAASRVLRAGGRDFISALDVEAGTTTLLVPSADGGLQPGLQVTGYPYGLLRLR